MSLVLNHKGPLGIKMHYSFATIFDVYVLLEHYHNAHMTGDPGMVETVEQVTLLF
jgi:hypothetical protein